MASKRRVVVVGAGPGGLTTAMILAKRGFEVTVLERKDTVGGRNAAIRLGPYTFDTGPTFLMMKGILDEVFQEAGADTAAHLQCTALDPMYRLQFPGFALHPTQNLERLKAEIEGIFPGKSAGVDAFMAAESRRFNAMMPCLQTPYLSLASLLSPRLLRVLPKLSLGRTVFENLRGYFGADDLALAFSFQSKYLGMSAWDCPGLFAMLAYIEYATGVWHVRGGLSEISEAMANVARANGADIRLGAEVESLRLDGRRVVGARLAGGGEVACDDIVVNADFAWAMSNLLPPGTLRRWSPEALRRKRFSCSTFMLYLGLDRTFDLPHHTIYFAEDYRRNVDDIFHRGLLSDDTSFYVRHASVTDPTLAPPGHSAIYILVPVANLRADIDWEAQRGPFRQRVLDTWRRREGLPDLEPHIRAEKVIAPPDWENDYNVHIGATFNLAHNLGQMLYLRPHNRFEELANCYLAGGGTHPGSGLPTIYESGRITANLISRKHGVDFETHNLAM